MDIWYSLTGYDFGMVLSTDCWLLLILAGIYMVLRVYFHVQVMHDNHDSIDSIARLDQTRDRI